MTGVLFLQGLALGLAIAAPLGPIGALCINRTLERGFLAGVAGGLGTALADGAYALAAGVGFAAFSATLAAIDTPLRLFGGVFMLWLAWRSLAPRSSAEAVTTPSRGLGATVASTFALTIANPATILSFAAIFAGLGLGAASGADAAILVAGVFSGSMLWWAALSGAIALLRHRLPARAAQLAGLASGILLAGFGAWAILSAAARLA